MMKAKLEVAYALTICMNIICLVLAVISLIAIAKKKVTYLRYYFYWKCLEIVIIPIFEIFSIVSHKKKDLHPT